MKKTFLLKNNSGLSTGSNEIFIKKGVQSLIVKLFFDDLPYNISMCKLLASCLLLRRFSL